MNFPALAPQPEPCHTPAIPKKPRSKPKPKRKPAKRQPREDVNQAAFRVMQEVIRRSEAPPAKDAEFRSKMIGRTAEDTGKHFIVVGGIPPRRKS